VSTSTFVSPRREVDWSIRQGGHEDVQTSSKEILCYQVLAGGEIVGSRLFGEPISFSPKVQSPGVNAGALRASVPSSRSIPNHTGHFRTILLLCTAVRRAGAGAPAHSCFSLGASRPATPVTSSRSLSKKEKALEAPAKRLPPLLERRGVTDGSSGTRCRRPCLARQTPAPHRLCRLSPAPCITKPSPLSVPDHRSHMTARVAGFAQM
jgi:hypothetical protein